MREEGGEGHHQLRAIRRCIALPCAAMHLCAHRCGGGALVSFACTMVTLSPSGLDSSNIPPSPQNVACWGGEVGVGSS